MSIIDGNDVFLRRAEELKNPYAAVNEVISNARKLMSNNNLLESQAISWALTGVKPKEVISSCKHDTVRNILKQLRFEIDAPKEVKQSVCMTIYNSINCGHLIYSYTQNLSDCDKPRVEILSNIWWDRINSEYIVVSRYGKYGKHRNKHKANN